MQNFDYMTPTRLIFGKESIVKLPEVMRPLGKRVLLTYGGGSIKKLSTNLSLTWVKNVEALWEVSP